jgi:hypothetical protein
VLDHHERENIAIFLISKVAILKLDSLQALAFFS